MKTEIKSMTQTEIIIAIVKNCEAARKAWQAVGYKEGTPEADEHLKWSHAVDALNHVLQEYNEKF